MPAGSRVYPPGQSNTGHSNSWTGEIPEDKISTTLLMIATVGYCYKNQCPHFQNWEGLRHVEIICSDTLFQGKKYGFLVKTEVSLLLCCK